MKDIGRNAPCPCGSGKKYKRCHWVESGESIAIKTASEGHFLGAYDTADLVKTFAALTILPENHGKNLRLERLTTQSILHRSGSMTIAPADSLHRYVAKFQSVDAMEERPVTLFTENVINEVGNNVIFPGITETGSFSLSNLLTAIYHFPGIELSAAYLEKVRQASLLLLHLSNIIARRMGYRRFMLARPTTKEIYFPDTETLKNAKQAVTFTPEEMIKVLERFGVDQSVLASFLSKPKSFKVNDEGESPILHQPVFFNGVDYTVASPATLSLALHDHIWVEAVRHGVMDEVNKAYHAVIWNNTNMYLQQLGYQVFGHKDIKLEMDNSRREGFYKFDDDKLALVYFVFDDGQNYTNPKGANLHFKKLQERRNAFAKAILTIPEFKNYKLLDIVIHSGIGREILMPYLINDQAESLFF